MCVSVCVSVKPHLTSGASVCTENTVTYSAGNRGKKIVGFSLKLLCCKDTPLPALYGYLCSRPFWNPHMCSISVSIAHAFSKIHACMVPRVLHFSTFIPIKKPTTQLKYDHIPRRRLRKNTAFEAAE